MKKKSPQKKSVPLKGKSKSQKSATKGKVKSAPLVKKPAVSGQKAELLGQIMNLASKLDEKSLRQLVQQANVLTYNMNIDLMGTPERGGVKDPNLDKHQSPTPPDKSSVQVREGEDGSFFVIAINNARNFFAREEMKKLVRICHASSSAADASQRIFAWLALEKAEVIKNTKITGGYDSALATIYKYIIENYTVKE